MMLSFHLFGSSLVLLSNVLWFSSESLVHLLFAVFMPTYLVVWGSVVLLLSFKLWPLDGGTVYHFGFDLYSPDDQLRLGTFSCVLTNGAPLAKCLLTFLGHVNKNGLCFSSLFAGILYIFWTQAIFRVYMLQVSSSALLLTSLLSWRATAQTHHFTPCSAAEILISSKAGGKHVCAEFTAFYGQLQRVFQEQL